MSVRRISVARLAELCDPFQTPPWSEVLYLTPDCVKRAIAAGDLEPNPGTSRHIQRIAYFVVHGWPDAIEVDVGIPCMGFTPAWPVQDGNHRFAAALVRGDEGITAELSGQVDTYKALCV